jgi:hypothetical protein
MNGGWPAVAGSIVASLILSWPEDGRSTLLLPKTHKVSVVSVGASPPSRVELDQGAEVMPLTPGPGGVSFDTSVPVDSAQLNEDLVMVAAYAPEDQLTLPLRLQASSRDLTVVIHHESNPQCVGPVISKLERHSQVFQDNLDAYFLASTLSQRQLCAPWAAGRVRRAWFDRSADLAAQDPRFRVDEEAQRAALQSGKTQGYVDMIRSQVDAVPFKSLNDAKVDALRAGDLDAAALYSRQEIVAVSHTAGTRESALRNQGLSLDQLRLDDSRIAERLRAQRLAAGIAVDPAGAPP